MAAPEGTIFAAHVPTITVLRDILQYGDARLTRCNAFNDTLLVFRKNYITSAGLRGSEIHDWKSAEHQAALTEMSQAFLDRDGNGEIFWPTDPKSPNFNSLKYSTQHPTIRMLVKQLIYRLNVQQHRNAKYKRKGQRHDDGDTLAQKAYPSIEISSDEAGSRSPVGKSSGSNEARFGALANVDGLIAHYLASRGSFTASNAAIIDHNDDDTHAFSGIPETHGRLAKRKPRGGASDHAAKRNKPTLPQNPTKRSQANNDAKSQPKWTSPRGAKTVRRPERAPTDDLDDAIASPTYSTTFRQTPEQFLEFIRNNRPSVTSEQSTIAEPSRAPPQTARKPVPIDPALERLVPVFTSSHSSESTPLLTQGSQQIPQSAPTPTSSKHHPPAPPSATQDPPPAPLPRPPSTTNPTPTTTTTTTTPKPTVEITYIHITSRKPIYKYTKHNLPGTFQTKTLSDLTTDLSITPPYESIILRLLHGVEILVEESIRYEKGEEDFAAAKQRFGKVVRSLVVNQARTRPGETLEIGIEVEALRSGDADAGAEGGEEDELGDFAW